MSKEENYSLLITSFNQFVADLYEKKMDQDFEFVEPTEKDKVDLLDHCVRCAIYETIMIGTRTLRRYEEFIADFEMGLFVPSFKFNDMVQVNKEEPEITIFNLHEYSDIQA